jgi:DNA helicase-2/ATP-dependent DNA helicase PcrA
VIIASAGSGKTSFLVGEALSRPTKKIAILTYTNNNINEIKQKFYERNAGIPKRVDVETWFSFLLHDCARPYQRSVYTRRRVKKICFQQRRSAPYRNHSDTEQYYFSEGDEIYSDKISRFVIDCQTNSNGLVTKRLTNIYDEIYIDEFQDLAGWDLDLLETLLKAGIQMVIVGDPRQCTYTTNNAAKNSRYRGIGIQDLFDSWKRNNLCQIENHARSYRCNQKICDFADMLWPNMGKTVSHNSIKTGHDGIFVVTTNNIHEYVKRYKPALLRYDRKTKETYGYSALNFGNAKGLEFDRVLIVPHGPIKKYLITGNVDDVKGSIEKFYVALTRAKFSVAFLYDGKCNIGCINKWEKNN